MYFSKICKSKLCLNYEIVCEFNQIAQIQTYTFQNVKVNEDGMVEGHWPGCVPNKEELVCKQNL